MMLRRRRIAGLLPAVLNQAGLSVPYSIDFTAEGDGDLPTPWVSESTWQVSSGLAVCTPVTFGSEELTDAGLEGTYTAGLNDALTEVGSGTPAEETSDVHGGSKAQKITLNAVADRCEWSSVGDANKFYLMSVWCKIATQNATPRAWFASSGDTGQYYSPNLTTDWAQYLSGVFSYLAVVLTGVRETGGTGDIVIFDDGSVKALSTSEVIAMLPATRANITVKAGLERSDIAYTFGIIARADSQTNPTSYLMAKLYAAGNTVCRATLLKVVSGTATHLVSGNVTYGSGKVLEIRCDGSTIQLFYDSAQVGGDQTVSDAEILNNKYHGFFSTGGGNSLDSFFLELP